MRRVTGTIEIAAPLKQVWEVLMDPRRIEEWVTINRGLGPLPELPLHDRAKLDQTLELHGRELEVNWELMEAHEPYLASWEGKGPGRSHATITYTLNATGHGTIRFDYVNDFYLPRWPKKWLARYLLRDGIAQREVEASLEKLKRLIEAEARPSGEGATASSGASSGAS